MQQRRLLGAPTLLLIMRMMHVTVRQLLLDSFGATLEDQLEREAQAIAAAGATPEARAAITAFLAKRHKK